MHFLHFNKSLTNKNDAVDVEIGILPPLFYFNSIMPQYHATEISFTSFTLCGSFLTMCSFWLLIQQLYIEVIRGHTIFPLNFSWKRDEKDTPAGVKKTHLLLKYYQRSIREIGIMIPRRNHKYYMNEHYNNPFVGLRFRETTISPFKMKWK